MASALLALTIRTGFPDYYELTEMTIAMVILGLIVKVSCAFLFGLYQHSGLSSRRILLKQLLLSNVVSSAIVGLLMVTSQRLVILQGSYPRIAILMDFAFTFLLLGISRLIFMGLRTDTNSQNSPADATPHIYFLHHWKQWLNDGLVYYGVVFGSLSIYMLWNRLAFGTFSPVSGQIKQWWAELPGRAYGGSSRDLLSFFGIHYSSEENAWNPASSIIGALAEKLYQLQQYPVEGKNVKDDPEKRPTAQP